VSGDSEPSIHQVLAEFLADQRSRLAPRTYRNYEYVVELLSDCLNGYAYQSLDEVDRTRWEAAYDAGDEEAFCRLFGPYQIVGNLSEFLGYFMVRKVIAGQELLRAAGTVTKKLASWLHDQGFIDERPTSRKPPSEAPMPPGTSPEPRSLAGRSTSWRSGLLTSWSTRSPTGTGWKATCRSLGSTPEPCGFRVASAPSRCRGRRACLPRWGGA
jgi:hypothetical protein